jgi:hypothetical protein
MCTDLGEFHLALRLLALPRAAPPGTIQRTSRLRAASVAGF